MNKESLITPKYISEEDYFIYTGYNLKEELVRSDDPSRDGLRILKECEDYVLNYLKTNYTFNEEMITETTKATFIKALCLQVQEVIAKGYSYKLREEVKPLLRSIGFMNMIGY